MRLLQFTAIKLSICLIIGILIGSYFNPSLITAAVLCILLLLLLGIEHFLVKRHSLHFGVLCAFLTIMIGVLSISLKDAKNNQIHYSHLNLDRPWTFTLKIDEVLKANNFSDRYIATVQQMDSLRVTGKIILYINREQQSTPFKVDDEIISYTTLNKVAPPLNPHQFDYRKYLKGLGIHQQLRLSNDQLVERESSHSTIFGLAAKVRIQIIDKLKQENFGKEELAIIQALLLGQRNEITEITNTDYKDAGAFHILALSGLHIGILLGLLHFVLSPLELLPKGRVIKLLVIVLLLWGFAFLAGMSSSILRAVTMFSFVAYALYLNRPTSHFNILALSLLCILLLFNPLLLFQVGFQLSYTAVFAILWIYPLLQKFWTPKNWILKRGWELISVSIAAQLGVLPLSLYYFHQFPGLFLVSSLLILPFLAIILGMGILVITLAVSNALPSFLVALYDGIIRWMNTIIGWVAQQESFIFRNIYFDIIQLFLAYGILITFISILQKASYKRTAIFLTSIICFQLWGLGIKYHIHNKEHLLLGHTGRNTTILHHSGQKVMVYTNNWSGSKRMATDYSVANLTSELTHQPLKNSFTVATERLLIIDSSFTYFSGDTNLNTIVLTQSPKINLDRLLDSVQPKLVLADGSNYNSYIERWKASCLKRKLPFHYTGEKGAYHFKIP
ncbi:ComEC/Rec2 family competence protein [Arenibacter latericius]|uniref:ComEC/Rec2 family competence protein n=1 Tax=Arenibacter latericius TaxID=86104 RepID=UPI00047975AC|nr:ComEC/Rec2 family competence protein [Arenibacter latericius]